MSTDVAIRDDALPPVTLFRTDNPAEVVARATETAKALSSVVKQQKLTVAIQGRDHVRVEGWTLLGTMLGVFPVCTWTRKLEDGWEARVEARTLAGHIVGAAEAECLRSERTWAGRDDFALRSMAQTRATSKALRQPLGFVMTLAGFDATPAEEMPVVEAPAERKTETTISEKQQGLLYALRDERHVPDDVMRNILREISGDPLVKSTTLPSRFFNDVKKSIEDWVPSVLTGADGEA